MGSGYVWIRLSGRARGQQREKTVVLEARAGAGPETRRADVVLDSGEVNNRGRSTTNK